MSIIKLPFLKIECLTNDGCLTNDECLWISENGLKNILPHLNQNITKYSFKNKILLVWASLSFLFWE